MAAGERFTINSRDVVHEVVDGEVIAIDLGRGSYYSLAGGAADAWAMLGGSVSAEELVAAFEGGPAPEEMAREVDALLGHLREEALVVAANGEAPTATAGSYAYRPFTFEKYEDLQDYFLLDPIHEVGTEGWPGPKPG